ncbi:biosynthetic arginine decarboxylase [Amaricoccus tamworthensis]|uniref:biosynthetic arginine decarboxylase n=1 Tax=Amaricoccus tamworthensis TaxID=57002 RepID=UPI003C7ABE13
MENDSPHDIYGIENWGGGMISVLPDGDIGLSNPLDPSMPRMSLPEIVKGLKQRGIQTPLLLRVKPFLENGVRQINESFAEVIKALGYKNAYRGVFPIKVNQQAQVIESIVEYGRKYHYGLEAGSKPELVIALSKSLSKEAMIICNGVKDAEFVRLAILSRKIGFNTVIVLESRKELDTVLDVAEELGEEPLLGVRIKLTHQIGGNWAESSGDRSTFGMNTDQIVSVIDRLKQAGLLHCLMLQHSHLGSQIPDVNDVRRAVTEACRYFSELKSEGAPLTHLDLGGGLGIDYTGEKTASPNSINYTIREYCSNVVETVAYSMDEAGLDHPVIITESGRAVVANSSILVFDVLETTLYDTPDAPDPQEGDHHLLSDMRGILAYLVPERIQECINDAVYYRNEMRALFRRGYIGLREMARGERTHMAIMSRIRGIAQASDLTTEIDMQLNQIADIYHCNFSLFQSLPDVWAIDQIHPVVPLQRLNEEPGRRAILSDITCDSDGKVDSFILSGGLSPSLPVHSIADDEEYFIGAFIVGAYQETLGDLHNLFGDTNVATVDLRPDGGVHLLQDTEGDTIHEVLSYVEYNPRDMIASFKKHVDEAASDGHLTPADRKQLIREYTDSINGYTYYE